MLALHRSYAKELFVVAMLGVTTLVVAATQHRSIPRHHRHQPDIFTTVRCEADRPQPQVITQHAVSDRDIELEYQLASALERAHDAKSSLMTKFEALRYARRLDLALGGTRADGLDTELRTVAPKAAVLYARSHNQEGLELALATCDALGVSVNRTLVLK